MQKLVPLKKIRANPYRNIDHYPIKREKVKTLKESYEKTGFWGNVVARERNGQVELAYGHHRWTALKETHKPNDKVPLIIQDLTNEDMIKIMARENMMEWGTSAEVEHETVRATVEAYAKGEIELPAFPADTPSNSLRYAPSYVRGVKPSTRRVERPYTAETLVSFVGYSVRKTQDILQRLEIIEKKWVSEQSLKNLSTKQADKVVRKAKDVHATTLDRLATSKGSEVQKKQKAAQAARHVSSAMAHAMKRAESAEEIEKQVAVAEKRYVPALREQVPDINEYVERFIFRAEHFLSKADEEWGTFGQVLKHKDSLIRSRQKRIKKALEGAAKRAQDWADKF